MLRAIPRPPSVLARSNTQTCCLMTCEFDDSTQCSMTRIGNGEEGWPFKPLAEWVWPSNIEFNDGSG